MVGVISLIGRASSLVGDIQDIEGVFSCQRDGVMRISELSEGSNEYTSIPVTHDGLAEFLLSPTMAHYRRVPPGNFPVFKKAELRGLVSTSDDGRYAVRLQQFEKFVLLCYGNRRVEIDLRNMQLVMPASTTS